MKHILENECNYLIDLGFEELDRDNDNILLIHKEQEIAVMLINTFNFTGKATANAINLKDKHQDNYSFIKKKTISFIKNFENNEERVLDDEYFFLKINIKDLSLMQLFTNPSKTQIDIIITKDKEKTGDIICNPYISTPIQIVEILKILTTTEKDIITFVVPLSLAGNAQYIKYFLKNYIREYKYFKYDDED